MTHYEGTEGKWGYNITNSRSRQSIVDSCQPHDPAALPREKRPLYALYRGLGWPLELFSEQINILFLQPGCKLS